MTRRAMSFFAIIVIIPIVVFTECCALMHQSVKLAAAFSRLSPSSSSFSTTYSTSLNYEPWGVGDNWSDLSSEAEEARTATHEDQLLDPIGLAVGILEATTGSSTPVADNDNSGADESISYDLTKILMAFNEETNSLSSSSEHGGSISDSTAEQEAEEIGFLIRCNQIPNKILAGEGRGLEPLSDEEKYDLSQLLMKNVQVTSFFNESIVKIFQRHSSFDSSVGIRVLDRDGIAKWMTTCLQDESVSKNDKRVLEVISRFSTYGTGYLKEQEFLQLYKDVLTVDIENGTLKRPSKRRISSVQKIWRDFAAHGIHCPNEVEWNRKKSEIETFSHAHDNNKNKSGSKIQLLHDECEVLEVNKDNISPHWTVDSKGAKNLRRSSHQLVELCSDNETPKRIRDGQFVFIDEESCIGCTQCVHAAPSSFMMLDTGRARAFHQRSTADVKSAVSACPVDCMKFISFQELQELETARDKGFGEEETGRTMAEHIPLFVAGIDSDAKHRSSWYHTLKHKCFTSSSCPKKGCYDCPMYSSPGENPYFKDRQAIAQERRKKDVLESNELNAFRKVVEL